MHDEAEETPPRPPEGDEDNGGLDVDQRRVEPAERLRRERLERGEQHGVLLVLHHVLGLGEDRRPDVAARVQRVRLGAPDRPSVPLVERGRGSEAHGRDREDGQEDERERFDHPADRARGDGLRHRRERPAPRGRHEPDHGDAGDRHDGQEADVDADHRPERRREAAGGQPDRECEPGDRGEERSPAWHPGHDDDQRAERREAEVEADEPERVAHEPVRRPSQTPSSSPIGSKLRRTAGGGGPNTITASASSRRVTATAG